jgi:hypothetical protein
MKSINWFFVISTFVLAFLLWQTSCNRQKESDTVIIKTDTVTVIKMVTKSDTVRQKEIVYLPAKKLPEPKIINVAPDTAQYIYNDKQEDSTLIIGYSVYTKTPLDSIRISYLLKQPKTITNTVTETITKEITKTVEITRNRFYVGGGISYADEKPDFHGALLFVSKKKYAIEYRYGVVQKLHALTYYRKL